MTKLNTVLPPVLFLNARSTISMVKQYGDSIKKEAHWTLNASDKLTVSDISERTGGVEGCGNQATNIWNGGTWVMNTDLRQKK